jgi:3-deoxy-manno-octulosonate cytidylyltransferase (CMP-KDO synthetase)
MSRPAFVPRVHATSYVVIPARLGSTRLPRKMLLSETGKPLVQHTYEAACRATRPEGVIIATDHVEIENAVRLFGGDVRMTSVDCASGTDRVAAVARELPDADILVNVQGDEPEISGEAIDRVVQILEEQPDKVMSTLATPMRNRAQIESPNCVKVVFDAAGRALYFSRSPIPFAREWRDDLLTATPATYHLHLGIYAYRRDFLLQLASMPAGKLERIEKLEQLRVLEAGHSIAVGVVDHAAPGIDTLEEYREFVLRCA